MGKFVNWGMCLQRTVPFSQVGSEWQSVPVATLLAVDRILRRFGRDFTTN
ncbi:hypothetical protein RESH_02910 [Rhodopirellula europaea SH398]|uniref:Uncharacterized protein n=1 Tax=Rhodopirellula europaea SH398 TaxID=1263868 RepID=M5S4S9_9BACT|nr:hypothetical protein RESH_02910 [Rhodopirellula europaea SH398]